MLTHVPQECVICRNVYIFGKDAYGLDRLMPLEPREPVPASQLLNNSASRTPINSGPINAVQTTQETSQNVRCLSIPFRIFPLNFLKKYTNRLQIARSRVTLTRSKTLFYRCDYFSVAVCRCPLIFPHSFQDVNRPFSLNS